MNSFARRAIIINFVSAKLRRLGNMSGWRTSFRRTSFVAQTNIVYSETTITHTISFWRQQLSQFVRKYVSQNKAKNAGHSGKNAGMREIRQNAGLFILRDCLF